MTELQAIISGIMPLLSVDYSHVYVAYMLVAAVLPRVLDRFFQYAEPEKMAKGPDEI